MKSAHKFGLTPNGKRVSVWEEVSDQIPDMHVKDSNLSPLASATAEVMSSPRDRVSLPSGYIDKYHCHGNTVTGNDCSSTEVTIEGDSGLCADISLAGSKNHTSVNSVVNEVSKRCENNDSSQLIFDVNYLGIDDKFVNSILHAKHY